MTENQNLGGFDMVLGLSQSTINFQFYKLFQRKFIKNNWLVLVGNVLKPTPGEKPVIIDGSDPEFKSKLNEWISIQNQIAEAKNAGQWSEIGKLIDSLKSKGLNFDYAWDSLLDSPTIEIISKDTQNLYFSLAFASGKLYFRPDDTSAVSSYDLAGCVYVFKVPIGSLKVTKDQMIMEADDEMESIIKESGLTEADFRIESLFLNFENANISTFDQSRSKLPEGATTPLQIAIENFFNLTIKGSDNPYILGYGVTQPDVKSDQALFRPTSLDYSTSFSDKKVGTSPSPGKFSAFNFLMMLNDQNPPTGQNAGVLPSSLIELGVDTTTTTDGVFAMNFDAFDEYLQSMDAYVVSVFSALDGIEVEKGKFQDKDGKHVMIATNHRKKNGDDIYTTYTVTRGGIQSVSGGLKIDYSIAIHIKVVVHILFVDYKVNLSTSGTYKYAELDKKGKEGSLSFLISSGATGKFNLDPDFKEPIIAFDDNPSIFGNDVWETIATIFRLIFMWPLEIVHGIVQQIADDLGRDGVKIENKKIEALKNLDVLNQTNKVILPLGKTYTYKNLRYVQNESLIAYDISYAPVTE